MVRDRDLHRSTVREAVSLPVGYRRCDDELLIGVAMPDAKTWWRNFLGEGGPVTVTLDGRERAGHAVATRDDGGVRSAFSSDRELAGLADVQRAQHPAHADPQRARQREVGDDFVGQQFVAALPEGLVLAQAGVIGGEALAELGGEPLSSL